MGNRPSINEEIAEILYRKVLDTALTAADQKFLDEWLRKSRYNRSVLEDITQDNFLRKKLADAFPQNRTEFWNIIINYRSAMHDGMQVPRNFWRRLARVIINLFSAGKPPS